MKYLIPIAIFLIFNVLPAQPQTISGVVNSYYKVISVNTPNSYAKMASVTGLNSGDRVLIIQMKGGTIDGTNASTFGDITAINNAGKYELNTICGLLNDTVYFRKRILNNYDPNGFIQLIVVPQYTDVTVAGTLNATPWDPVSGTGGVVVIEASGSITVNANISVDGAGFQGGVMTNYPTPTYDCIWTTNVADYYTSIPPNPNLYHIGGTKGEGVADYLANKQYARGKQANGGGGGNNHNTGGGGGSNYGAGGTGGQRSNETAFQCHGLYPGIGGLSLSAQGYSLANNRIYMGGGGGNGHENNNVGIPGGNGGGIIVLKCDQLIGGGTTISANGARPYNAANTDPYSSLGDGGSGGGAGGTIILNYNSFSGTATIQSQGAKGSDASYGVPECMGPGGGGGGGAIWLSTAATPGGMVTSATAGANGVVSAFCGTATCRNQPNGATPGAVGATLFNNQIPEGTVYACSSVLASDPVAEFWGDLSSDYALLQWKVSNVQQLLEFQLERSGDGINFNSIAEIPYHLTNSYSYTDKNLDPFASKIFYRLKLVYADGRNSYSKIIFFNRQNAPEIKIYPNPTRNGIFLEFSSPKSGFAELCVYDATGKKVKDQHASLVKGYNQLNISVSGLSNGFYYLKIKTGDWQIVRSFVKQE